MHHATRALIALTALAATLAACEYDPALEDGPAQAEALGDAGVDAAPTASEEPAPIGEHRQAIHGDPVFHDCTTSQRNALRDALDYAQARAASGEYRDCLADAFGVEAEGRMVEELVADTNTLRGVDFYCVAGDDGANAGYDQDGNESMNIVGALTANTPTADLAAIIVHEIAHNHGWWHNHFYGPTWPDMVQGCILRGQPFGVRRSDVAGERLLAPVGGEGGRYHRLRCGEDEAMVGVRPWLQGDTLASIQPICQSIEGSTRTGGYRYPAVSVPGGAWGPSDICPAGKVVTGIEGSAGPFVRRVRAVCSDIGDLRRASGGVAVSTLPYRGRIQDYAYSRRCPPRTAATGMRTRLGALVDAIQLECDDFPLQQRDLGIAISGHGGWGGSYSQLECPGTFGLDGIYGQRDMDSGDLATIGGRCRAVNDQGVAQGDDWGWSMAFTERAGRTQPTEDDGIMRRSYCDDDEVLVGLSIAADNIVGDVSALCADLDTWMTGDTTTRQATGVRVRAGETVQHVVCPARKIATDLEVRSGWLIDRVDLRCDVPDIAGDLEHLTSFGGNGGTGYEEICPDGRPLVGLRTETYAGGLHWLNGRCGRHTDTGTSVVSPIDLPVIGGDEHADNIDDCPLGKVMVGVEVAHGDRLANWVRGVCADESSVRAGGDPAGLSLTPWRGGGGDWHTITRTVCDDGEVVRGLYGRRGALQDRFGAVCGNVPLLPGSLARGSANLYRAEVHMLTVPAGSSGDLRLILSGYQYMQPTVRIRRGAMPTANVNDGSVNGVNGVAWLEVSDLAPGRYYVEVTTRTIIGGSYSLSVTEL